jgi:hypothetical protein
MADLKLDITVIPTYNVLTLGVIDTSTYPDDPPIVTTPTIEITVPSFGIAVLPFVVNSYNLFNSVDLGITEVGNEQPLPDGIYRLKYSVAPAYLNFVERTIMRTDKIQEKFDRAFLKLDLMECDRAIKTQSTVTLNTINFFIQGSIAAANNCADFESNKLYIQANNMLDSFIKNNCGCSGNNYQLNFY